MPFLNKTPKTISNHIIHSPRLISTIIRFSIKNRFDRKNYKEFTKLRILKIVNFGKRKNRTKNNRKTDISDNSFNLEKNDNFEKEFGNLNQYFQQKSVKNPKQILFIEKYSQGRLLQRIKTTTELRIIRNPKTDGDLMPVSPEELELVSMKSPAGSAAHFPEQYTDMTESMVKNSFRNNALLEDRTNVMAYFMKGKLGVDAWLSTFAFLGIILLPIFFYARLKNRQHFRKLRGIDPDILRNPEKYGYDLDSVSPQYLFNNEIDENKERLIDQRSRLRQKIDKSLYQ